MKLRPCLLFIASIIGISIQTSYAADTPPGFEDYPVTTIYSGPVADPMFAGDDSPTFRASVLQYRPTQVNFAGKYAVEVFGCGASCVQGVIIDAQTGKLIRFPFGDLIAEDPNFANPVTYQKDSSLIVFKGDADEKGKNRAFYYVMQEGKLRHVETEALAKVSGPPQQWAPSAPP